MIKKILSISSIYNSIGHILVLSNLYSIKNIDLFNRKIYFTFDLITVILSFLYLKNKKIKYKNIYYLLVLIHIYMHISAIIHLFYNNNIFYKNVFEMAESNFKNKKSYFVIKYYLGTIIDITVQIIHSYYLIF
tara:strand:- start:81 stop:479 length:399 start_codon:yes stop_codon:yes gene_type:complete